MAAGYRDNSWRLGHSGVGAMNAFQILDAYGAYQSYCRVVANDLVASVLDSDAVPALRAAVDDGQWRRAADLLMAHEARYPGAVPVQAHNTDWAAHDMLPGFHTARKAHDVAGGSRTPNNGEKAMLYGAAVRMFRGLSQGAGGGFEQYVNLEQTEGLRRGVRPFAHPPVAASLSVAQAADWWRMKADMARLDRLQGPGGQLGPDGDHAKAVSVAAQEYGAATRQIEADRAARAEAAQLSGIGDQGLEGKLQAGEDARLEGLRQAYLAANHAAAEAEKAASRQGRQRQVCEERLKTAWTRSFAFSHGGQAVVRAAFPDAYAAIRVTVAPAVQAEWQDVSKAVGAMAAPDRRRAAGVAASVRAALQQPSLAQKLSGYLRGVGALEKIRSLVPGLVRRAEDMARAVPALGQLSNGLRARLKAVYGDVAAGDWRVVAITSAAAALRAAGHPVTAAGVDASIPSGRMLMQHALAAASAPKLMAAIAKVSPTAANNMRVWAGRALEMGLNAAERPSAPKIIRAASPKPSLPSKGQVLASLTSPQPSYAPGI